MVGKLLDTVPYTEPMLRRAYRDDAPDGFPYLSYTWYYSSQSISEYYMFASKQYGKHSKNDTIDIFRLCESLLLRYCRYIECFLSVDGGEHSRITPIVRVYKNSVYREFYNAFRRQVSQFDRREDYTFIRYFCVRMHFGSTSELNGFKLKYANNLRVNLFGA